MRGNLKFPLFAHPRYKATISVKKNSSEFGIIIEIVKFQVPLVKIKKVKKIELSTLRLGILGINRCIGQKIGKGQSY